MFEKTKTFCDSFLEFGMPGFDLAVYQNGKCILRYFNGFSCLEDKIKMNGFERYNLYSCSKAITCTAALQLWEKGLFSLDDKLSDYMPEFKEMFVRTENGIERAKKPILIKHLFEMTAGFSYDHDSPSLKQCKIDTDGECPTRETMKYLAKEPLLFEPGDRWEYSLCHDVLAALIEVVSGEKFEIYVKKNIFEVAGMERSSFMLPEEELDTVTEQYQFKDGRAINVGKKIVSHKLGSKYASGGAGCVSTVDDYMKFLESLRTNKFIKPETLGLMMTNRLTERQERAYWARQTHGFGLGVRCPKGNEKYQDFGWSGWASAYWAVDIENKLSIFFGSHLLDFSPFELIYMFYRIIRAEIIDNGDFENIKSELKKLYDYNLI